MASDIDGGKLPIIPKESSDPSSTTYVVNAANKIGTVLKPGDVFYDVIIDPKGRQTNLGKKVFKDSKVEEVPLEELVNGANSDEKQNVKLVEDPEDSNTFNNDIAAQAALYQFLQNDDVDGGLGNPSFGGFDDDGGFF